MTERMVDVADGVRLCVDVSGAGETLVLVHGAGCSLVAWPDGLVDLLARHHRVLRYDARDQGRSTTWPVGEPGYGMSDVVGDVLALLDDEGVDRAHVLGLSGGGLVGQLLALDHPAPGGHPDAGEQHAGFRRAAGDGRRPARVLRRRRGRARLGRPRRRRGLPDRARATVPARGIRRGAPTGDRAAHGGPVERPAGRHHEPVPRRPGSVVPGPARGDRGTDARGARRRRPAVPAGARRGAGAGDPGRRAPRDPRCRPRGAAAARVARAASPGSRSSRRAPEQVSRGSAVPAAARAAAGRCRGRAPGSGPAGCRRSRTGRSPAGPGRAPPSRGRGCRARRRGRDARSPRSAGPSATGPSTGSSTTAGTTSSSSHGRVSCACADRLWNETPSSRTESLMPAARAAWCAAARSSAGSAVGCGRVTDRVSVVKSANRTLATTVRAPPPCAVSRRSASSVTRSTAAAIRSVPKMSCGERALRTHRLALAAGRHGPGVDAAGEPEQVDARTTRPRSS